MKINISELCSYLDLAIPLSYQAGYDNSGIQVLAGDSETGSALLTLDVTEAVMEEAVVLGCGLIISHHPLLFHPLKKIAGRNQSERIAAAAIRNNISIYSAHTNLDFSPGGVSCKMAEKLSLKNVSVLSPLKDRLMKLVTWVPEAYIGAVRDAVFSAGAGVIGNYDQCSFNSSGYGTFRGGESSNPFAGEKGKIHHENEIRFETIFLAHLRDTVVRALIGSHPYEEVAYDIYSLQNEFSGAGEGCIGDLEEPLAEMDFLKKLSETFDARGLRYSDLAERKVRRIALCGGAGAALIGEAIKNKADAFVTGDVRYHDFGNAAGQILLADIGHFESEKYSTEILYDLIIKKFPTFALRFSERNTNPINYL